MGANCGDCSNGWHDNRNTFGNMPRGPGDVGPVFRPQWNPTIPQRKQDLSSNGLNEVYIGGPPIAKMNSEPTNNGVGGPLAPLNNLNPMGRDYGEMGQVAPSYLKKTQRNPSLPPMPPKKQSDIESSRPPFGPRTSGTGPFMPPMNGQLVPQQMQNVPAVLEATAHPFSNQPNPFESMMAENPIALMRRQSNERSIEPSPYENLINRTSKPLSAQPTQMTTSDIGMYQPQPPPQQFQSVPQPQSVPQQPAAPIPNPTPPVPPITKPPSYVQTPPSQLQNQPQPPAAPVVSPPSNIQPPLPPVEPLIENVSPRAPSTLAESPSKFQNSPSSLMVPSTPPPRMTASEIIANESQPFAFNVQDPEGQRIEGSKIIVSGRNDMPLLATNGGIPSFFHAGLPQNFWAMQPQEPGLVIQQKNINGITYKGTWKGPMRHGTGVQRWPDGSMYEGMWRDDVATGLGRFTFANGDIYEGQFVNDMANGRGALKRKDGSIADGTWTNDELNGLGKQIWPDGTKYEGNFSRGRKHGQGRYVWSDKSEYTGTWYNDTITGEGRAYWADGKFYDGQWLNNRKHGKGTHNWFDGRLYEGEYENDFRQGTGVYILPDGSKYNGQWYQGKRHGTGSQITSNGQLISGNWQNGRLVN